MFTCVTFISADRVTILGKEKNNNKQSLDLPKEKKVKGVLELLFKCCPNILIAGWMKSDFE